MRWLGDHVAATWLDEREFEWLVVSLTGAPGYYAPNATAARIADASTRSPRDATRTMTGADLLIQCLQAQGVNTVFGMPGTQNLAVYDALYRAGQEVCHILIRNEQAATMMAGGWARATGTVGVALTVPGPGASNASTGIADAYTDCQPMLLVTGGVERPMHRRDRSKMFHGLDQEAFFRPITRYYGCPQSASEIPEMVHGAFSAIWSRRPGPAVLEIPPDLALEPCDSLPVPPLVRADLNRSPESAEVAATATLIRAWQKPLVLVGGDVIASQATLETQQLAACLGAPLIHTRLGKCAVPSGFALNFGNVYSPRAKQLLDEADGLIAVGVRFTQIDTRSWSIPIPPQLVQLDRDDKEIGREYPITAGIVGDLQPSLRSLLGDLKDVQPSSKWDETTSKLDHDVRPGPVLREVREALSADGIVVSDVTSLTYRAFDEYPIFGTRDFLYPCHYVTLGYGLPAAMGAKVACPDRQVVAICGDGGVMMSIGELATAAQHRINVVVVVISDSALLAIKASQIKGYEKRVLGTELLNPDFVALATSMGVHAHRTSDLEQFQQILSAELAQERPSLIEISMDGRQQEIMNQIPWL
jgi:acetolactate synthase-1/2/3 large subunit